MAKPLELSEAAAVAPVPAARASNKGCLAMPFAEYLQILDWTGRVWRSDKSCAIPDGLAPILERLALTDESWMHLVRDFRRKFRRAAGTPESMKKEADKHGCRKMYGIGHRREIFERPPQSSALRRPPSGGTPALSSVGFLNRPIGSGSADCSEQRRISPNLRARLTPPTENSRS